MEIIIDCQCFPCIDYFKKLGGIKHVKIETYETFQKMSFRNRYVIAGANGLQTLSIPIVGGREQKKIITEIKIDYSVDWATKHWRSITSGYSKAPFFEYYNEDVRALLFSKEDLLINFNLKVLAWLFKVLKVKGLIEFTEEFRHMYAPGVDLRNQLTPKNYQLNNTTWNPKYSQVFEDRLGFQANLSILDLLFCQGPNAVRLIEESVNRQ